jgi:hypothetical protein
MFKLERNTEIVSTNWSWRCCYAVARQMLPKSAASMPPTPMQRYNARGRPQTENGIALPARTYAMTNYGACARLPFEDAIYRILPPNGSESSGRRLSDAA